MINEYILCNVAFTGILFWVSVVLTVSPIRMPQCRLLCLCAYSFKFMPIWTLLLFSSIHCFLE